ncbi:leucine-rich repeat-containing protein 3-like [Chanos chanos]|uniref:Leucine-rich repeat-containing protein 3 n=1 Tax=Chanos chanos TaxID=29144 RepID=A0A6J2VZW2_CHACN|nr:leucine-rich repeat-containing protein 3-like [Chanos chanos]
MGCARFQGLISALVLAVALISRAQPCPKNCHCSDRNGLTVVQCASRKLEEIPSDLPENTVSLQLASNRITRIPSQAFKGLRRLQELDMSGNTIEVVERGAFQGVSEGLQAVDLSNNLLHALPRDTFGRLHAKINLAGNPWHCECTLQEVLRELQLDPDTVNQVSCRTAVREEYAGKPVVQVLDSGVDLCNIKRKTTDVAMFITMFGWFTMVIAYVVYYVRQNREDARRHLEYLKALPSNSGSRKDSDTISTVL